MDSLTTELSVFLEKMHAHPDLVSEKVEHYMEHFLYLLPDTEMHLILSYYGLFDVAQKSADELADQEKTAKEQLQKRIEHDLRRLAVAPEWEIIKRMI